MAPIRISNVTKAYGALEVLKDFSLDIEDGEFVVLVGPSGCGKSTMLKIMAGLEVATRGHVFIGDRDVTDVAPGDRDIAMVFQNYALYPHLTVRKNMGFGLKMRGVDRKTTDSRVEDAARILDIGHLLERRPRQLSGGQRQRVALGRAIVREPLAFLMDEPLSNLDAKLRVQMRAEIGSLHKRLGVTTIFVTHDQTEAMTMADRIVIMRDGTIQQIADPDTMFSKPRNLFVAGFIGSPGMNFFVSDVTGDGDAVSVNIWGQKVAMPERTAALAPRVGRKVVAGLRPEYIQLGSGKVQLTAAALLVESLGSEKHVFFELPPENRGADIAIRSADDERRDDAVVARLSQTGPIIVGQDLTVGFDPSALLLFDADTHDVIA